MGHVYPSEDEVPSDSEWGRRLPLSALLTNTRPLLSVELMTIAYKVATSSSEAFNVPRHLVAAVSFMEGHKGVVDSLRAGAGVRGHKFIPHTTMPRIPIVIQVLGGRCSADPSSLPTAVEP